MRGSIMAGIGTVAAIASAPVTAELFGTMLKIVAIIIENWIPISIMIWVLTSGVLFITTPMSILDSFGFTLYVFYAFFMIPIPIPATFWGIVIGADPITMIMLLMFNVFKLGLAAIFHLFLAISGFFYSWHIVKLTLDVLNTLR